MRSYLLAALLMFVAVGAMAQEEKVWLVFDDAEVLAIIDNGDTVELRVRAGNIQADVLCPDFFEQNCRDDFAVGDRVYVVATWISEKKQRVRGSVEAAVNGIIHEPWP
jgi:hypothetical protein